MIDGVKVITSPESSDLSFKRLLSSLGIITLSLIEVLFILVFFIERRKKMSSVRRVERRLIVFRAIMEGLSLEAQRRWIARCVKEAKKDPSLSEAERSAYINAVSNYYEDKKEVL